MLPTAPAAADTIGAAWTMKPGTSQVAQTLSALKAFGLLEVQRGPSGAEIVISDDARTYLRAQQESIRQEVVQRIALKPKQIQVYWEKWGDDRPKDPACLDALVLKGGFSQDGAVTFLKVYDATIAFARLTIADKANAKPAGVDADAGEAKPENGVAPPPPPPAVQARIGDYIQWTSAGVDQLHPPGRVTWIADDGSHLRVHGSLTGIPMSEVAIVDPPKPPAIGAQATRASSAYAGVDGDLNVLLTGARLQITADVDLAGVARLKEVLGHYENILKLLAPASQAEKPN